MSSLTYNKSELQQINDEVWSNPPSPREKRVSAHCPVCGADVGVLISWAGTRDGCGAGVLLANCDGCDRSGRIKPSEERCPDFDDHMEKIVHHHQHGELTFCPTCHTKLRIKRSPTLGALHYSAYCYRGGGMGKLSLQR